MSLRSTGMWDRETAQHRKSVITGHHGDHVSALLTLASITVMGQVKADEDFHHTRTQYCWGRGLMKWKMSWYDHVQWAGIGERLSSSSEIMLGKGEKTYFPNLKAIYWVRVQGKAPELEEWVWVIDRGFFVDYGFCPPVSVMWSSGKQWNKCRPGAQHGQRGCPLH